MKRRKKYNRKIYLIVLIIVMVFIILIFFNSRLKPKIDNVLKKSINANIYRYIFNMFSVDTLTSNDMLNIIKIYKNENDEVISVDYQFNEVYKYLSSEMVRLYDNVNNIKLSIDGFKSDNNVIFIPFGYGTNNIFLENLGFKIPCKVELLSNVKMGFKTRVSNYGINNILVELYLVISVQNNLIFPYNMEDFGDTYEMIIASKIIIGDIPLYYGDVIEKNSAIISS